MAGSGLNTGRRSIQDEVEAARLRSFKIRYLCVFRNRRQAASLVSPPVGRVRSDNVRLYLQELRFPVSRG